MSASKESDLDFATDNWCYLHDRPSATGVIRSQPEDFQVDEELGFEPSGDGSHLWINVSKRLLNTMDVVKMIAAATGINKKDIGFSGQKDRNAVTTQWYSLPHDNRPENLVQQLEHFCASRAELKLNRKALHPTKLRRGVHHSNRFRIRIRSFDGDQQDLESRIRRICAEGAPNYFGPQRFGRKNRNLKTALRFFDQTGSKLDRNARGMALSAARSWIFNQVLSDRINFLGCNDPEPGDAMLLDGSNAFFIHDGSDPSVVDRIRRHDLHITGPLWGQGELPTRGRVARFESLSVGRIRILPEGLEHAGLRQQRRALRLIPRDLSWRVEQGRDLYLEFVLTRGTFATAFLRELFYQLEEPMFFPGAE
ncbi:MAG: tRNA pseudouridine(13) synthase TruD [Gammaproteobacteria bacterium]